MVSVHRVLVDYCKTGGRCLDCDNGVALSNRHNFTNREVKRWAR